MKNFFLNFVKITGYPPFLIYLKPRKYWASRAARVRGGAEIVIANHTTLLDFVMLAFLYKFRVVRVLMAEVLYKTKLSAWFMRKLRGIRVDRQLQTEVAYMRETEQCLLNGEVVGVFPEGRLNPDGKDFGNMLPFSQGFAYLALTTGAPVRPVYLRTVGGAFRSAAMLVGERVDLRALFGDKPTPEALSAACQYMRVRMEAMRDELKILSAHKTNAPLSRYLRFSIRRALFLAFRPTYHFEAESPQRRRLTAPTIVISNHANVYDPPLICAAFPRDRLHMVACETLYEKPLMAWLLDRLGCVKIDRELLDMEAFHAIVTIIRRGESVGIFPEGAMFEFGEPRDFKEGFVISAMITGANVLPVFIDKGPGLLMGRQHIWIGAPMHIEVDMTSEGIKRETQRARQAVVALYRRAEQRKGEQK